VRRGLPALERGSRIVDDVISAASVTRNSEP
jgi:hypothetical protein